MDDLISRQALRRAMYHEAFEVDSDEQKWDSGCWIRYKMFERIVEAVPSAQKHGNGMTFEELKAEANRQGYGLHKLTRGICSCVTGREWQLANGRKKCLKYEWAYNTKSYCHCRKIEGGEQDEAVN